jgi:hypothetical protein
MTILTNLIKFLVKSPKVLSQNGGPITEWEQDFFEKWGKKTGKWKCPNCESDFLCEGPEGGMSQNIRCHTCGQGYNLTPMGIYTIGVDKSWINEEKLRAKKLNRIKSKI